MIEEAGIVAQDAQRDIYQLEAPSNCKAAKRNDRISA